MPVGVAEFDEAAAQNHHGVDGRRWRTHELLADAEGRLPQDEIDDIGGLSAKELVDEKARLRCGVPFPPQALLHAALSFRSRLLPVHEDLDTETKCIQLVWLHNLAQNEITILQELLWIDFHAICSAGASPQKRRTLPSRSSTSN